MGIKGFEERITNARKEKGYTQEELAMRLGVTPQAVSKWERGLGYPDLETLCFISEILDCSIDYLLHRESKKERLTEDGDDRIRKQLLGKILAEPIVIEAGNSLIPLLEEENRNQFDSIRRLREKMASQYGILLPLVRVRDNVDLGEQEYMFKVYDKVLFSAKLLREDITFQDICINLETLCLEHYNEIINRQVVQTLVDNLAENYPAVVKGIIPDKISLSLLQKVLPELLKKRGSIRNLVKIIEILDDEIQLTQKPEELIDIIVKKL